ncbi:hypothetical protein Cgig2_022895 [Carnegiea gigantea]|uniref:Uncharacterized protein n=1 Tax=Carnegiea gigantea TaxID=171969 RepID=A0A9Q1QMP0_9CARY|nr:hypothetical protein Cgig2_022895 [Carnegiea gigantea]
MEATNTSRSLPHFDYVPTTCGEPSYRHAHAPSPHHTERDQEISRSNLNGWPHAENHDWHAAVATRPSGHFVQGQTAKSTTTSTPTQLTPGKSPNSRSRNKLPNPKRKPQKLTYPGRDIVPLVHPILGFGGQEVNHTGMICFPIRFDNRLKARNLEVDFLVVDVPNVSLGHRNLCKESQPQHPRSWLPRLSGHHPRRKRRWYRATGPFSFQRSVAALTSRAKASAIVISSSVTLRGSEVPKAAKSQDFIKRLGEYRLRPTTQPPQSLGCRQVLGEQGFGLQQTASLRGEEERIDRPLIPSMGRGGGRRLIWAAFSALALTNSLLVHKVPLLFFPALLSFGHHLLGGGVPGLEDCQLRLHLLCIEQKGVRSEPNENAHPKQERQSTLRKILKGSLSLDLLFLFSGPFTYSIACAMNFRIGRGLSSSLMK